MTSLPQMFVKREDGRYRRNSVRVPSASCCKSEFLYAFGILQQPWMKEVNAKTTSTVKITCEYFFWEKRAVY